MFDPSVDLKRAGATVRSWSVRDVAGIEPGGIGVVLDEVRLGLDRLARLGALDGLGAVGVVGAVGGVGGLGESGSGFDGEMLRGVLESLELAGRVLDAAKAHVAYGLVRSGGCDETGLAAPVWLADAVKQPSGATRARFRVSAALVDGTLAPVIDEALSAGVIGWSHVEVLAHVTNTRNQDQMAVLAPVHVERALVLSFHRWKQEIRVAAELFDADGPEPGNDDESVNRLSFGASDKFTLLRGQLDAANAATVTEAIEAVTDELFRSRQRDAEATGGELEIPDRATLRAMALVEICRRATAKPVGETTPGRPEVSLSVGPDNFAHGVTRWGDTVTLADSVLFCAPDLVTILTDTHGNPKRMGPGFPFQIPPRPAGGFGLTGDLYKQLLNELETKLPAAWEHTRWQLDRGRQVRYATPEQRRALAARDGGCVFPGCDMPHAWTDAHHIRWWRHDGTTDIDNLISLCRRHHGIAHTTGWSVTLDKCGWTHWGTPNGRRLHGQRHHTQPTPTGPNGRNSESQGSSVGGSGIVHSSDQCRSDQGPHDKPPPGQPPNSPPGTDPHGTDPPGTDPHGTDPPCCGHD